MNELLRWETLLTVAGAGAATRYIVALLKTMFSIEGRANHLAALLVAQSITIGAGLAVGIRSPAGVALLALNGFIVAGFAIGLNENLALR